MPRRRAAPAPAKPAPKAAAPPPPAAAPPPPAAPPPMAAPPQQSGGMMSGLGGMVMQGMAMGTGSAIAHRAVDSAFGAMGGGSSAPAEPAAAAPQAADACGLQNKAFNDCLQNSAGDVGKCQFYYDMLNQCKQQA
mmetsp:Transcript_23083/g.27899  ORF Transcript_23083/g.27899 Transcript_23083/m.27899 type:complete len:135 (-) Transcript_23083:326-730(-)|eukprot:CAMPEP_0197865690 /NCGR_PEP_ID=MMETSP1438-20131217/43805_1 /TAXON_ID=1461541 /ORGANISM="Pterosperma sp., Strain CCMP1384" /LENGTH=134 /DNA_ID=CAMNT_0043484185 /DNA_START=517 /DNA_END=921 /DNA_ORIENTATION=+